MLGIIDIGSFNSGSVLNALDELNIPYLLIKEGPELPEGVTGLIVPGVGHFETAMEKLVASELDKVIVQSDFRKFPIMGICLGMQLFAKTSDETRIDSGVVKGLGLVPAKVRAIAKRCHSRVPHMGWNDLKDLNLGFYDFGNRETYYFVHSHEVIFEDADSLFISRTNDEEAIVAAYSYNNIIGLQFHPEKSQEAGLRILKKYWDLLC